MVLLFQKLLCFRSRVEKVPVQMALYSTVAYKVNHNSGLKHAKETCGPAPIVVK